MCTRVEQNPYSVYMELIQLDPKFDGGMMCGPLNPVTPEDGVVIRACRAASREHAIEDPYAMPLDEYGCDVSYKLYRARELRESRGGKWELPAALPWQACRVVHVGFPDNSYPGARDLYTLVVRYATSGACVCYGVREDGTLVCYWN